MACQCGCCDPPEPAEGKEDLTLVEVTEEGLQRKVEELDRRVKELETAA